MKRQALFFALLTVAAFFVGCGGRSDGGGTGGTGTTTLSGQSDSLTKAEFIKRGDEVCKKGGEEVGAEATAYAKQNGIDLTSTNLPQAQLSEIVENVVIPGIQRQVDGLRALSPPEGEEETTTAFIDGLQKGVEEGEGDPVTFSTGKTLAPADKKLQEYGFKVCGQGGEAESSEAETGSKSG
jgi:hypothetical protein